MTDRKNYNKLVRDRIPEIIAADGRQCSTEIMSDDEYRQALLAKLVEEAQEVAAADRDEMVKEIADLYEVIDALLIAFGLDREAVLAIQRKRHDGRGGFEKRIKLLWTE
jgi:predicted house-cleaning noncanonical NTP pyrophosphatase (MazG superfamily)